MSTPSDGRWFQGLRGAWRHRLEDGLRRSRSPPTASSKGGQGVLEAARSGLDDVLVSSPAAVGASALSSRELSQVPPHAFPCLLLAPLVLPIGTDAIPVLKPAPSRPQTLLTADPCAILTGLIREERSRISSDEAAESSEDLNNHQQSGAEGRGDA